jgi:hypothetical protein
VPSPADEPRTTRQLIVLAYETLVLVEVASQFMPRR